MGKELEPLEVDLDLDYKNIINKIVIPNIQDRLKKGLNLDDKRNLIKLRIELEELVHYLDELGIKIKEQKDV